MWTYRQSTGAVSKNGLPVIVNGKACHGYSGHGVCKNRPADENRIDMGPIPRGRYKIGADVLQESFGPLALALSPAVGQEMHGRGGFLIHGDSKTAPGTASHGCIILPRAVRELMEASADRDLEVVI
jgi:hypothetical protein